jgi:cell division septation protein DedD
MADRDDKNNSGKKPYGDSVELFEGIFQNSLESIKQAESKDEQGKEIETPPSDHKAAVEAEKTHHDAGVAEKSVHLDPDTRSDRKTGKGPKVLIIALSVVLLVVLTGALLKYLDIAGFVRLIGVPRPIDEPVTQRDVSKRFPDEIVKKEEAVTSVQPSVQVEGADQAKTVEKPRAENAFSPTHTVETFAEKKGTADEQPTSVAQPKEEKIPDKEQSSPGERSLYPYSVLLGAFSSIERAKLAISMHRKDGLSPYYVKVDLGEKGVWFRIFTGHFEGKEQAEALISKKQLKDASIKNTRYAAFIGSYSTKKELDDKWSMLSDLGYSPYAIDGADGWSYLFIGAFYTKTGATLQQQDLASKGIKSEVVER